MLKCVFVTFPSGILGHVWYLIVSIHDLCHLSKFTPVLISMRCTKKHHLDLFEQLKFFVTDNLHMPLPKGISTIPLQGFMLPKTTTSAITQGVF